MRRAPGPMWTRGLLCSKSRQGRSSTLREANRSPLAERLGALYHNIWRGSSVESPSSGDIVSNDHDYGPVLKVTPSWVHVDNGEPDGRWVHRERFEDGEWTVDAR